jgi:hypothetical protein
MFAKFMIGMLYTTLIGGAVLFHEGAITVNVEEKKPGGDHVVVFAPAAVVPWAIRLTPREHFPMENIPVEARPAISALAAATDKLRDMPDFVLVEVQSAREYVKIQKIGGSLVINVDSDKETVHVSVPLRAARHALEELAARLPRELSATP